MIFLWVALVTLVAVLVGTSLCFWFLHKAREASITIWILEHILCPIIRILVLLVIVSQVYPVIDTEATSGEFWYILSQQGQFKTLLNILFFAGLLLSFVPFISHPVFSLPIQSLLTIALVFHWQNAAVIDLLQLLPSGLIMAEIIVYMSLAYLVTRETSISLSRRIDRKLSIEGSIRLVSDVVYLVLQVPVMLIYCSYLAQQLAGQ